MDYVIGRSADLAAPEDAIIWAFANFDPGPHPTFESLAKRMGGRADATQSAGAKPVALKQLPPELAGKVQAEDLIAAISDRPAGELVVCALGFAKKQFADDVPITASGPAM